MTCKHKSGAHVPGIAGWVCSHCFNVLDGRPVIYRIFQNREARGGERQEIVWQASIAEADGITFAAFLDAGARRITSRSNAHREEALKHFLDFLRDLGVRYGDPDYCWDAGAARDIADELMSDWKQSGLNS